jgi:hypothetical protein
VTVFPATETPTERPVVSEFATIVSVTVPLPLLLDGEAVTQEGSPATVQAQPLAVETATLTLPPPAATDTVVGDTV